MKKVGGDEQEFLNAEEVLKFPCDCERLPKSAIDCARAIYLDADVVTKRGASNGLCGPSMPQPTSDSHQRL